MILVSNFGHCLNDLLYRNSIGQLPMELVAVVSNHEALRRRVEAEGAAFLSMPVTNETKRQQEADLAALFDEGAHRAGGARPLHADPVQ